MSSFRALEWRRLDPGLGTRTGTEGPTTFTIRGRDIEARDLHLTAEGPKVSIVSVSESGSRPHIASTQLGSRPLETIGVK